VGLFSGDITFVDLLSGDVNLADLGVLSGEVNLVDVARWLELPNPPGVLGVVCGDVNLVELCS
jgi:hypothetical protein